MDLRKLKMVVIAKRNIEKVAAGWKTEENKLAA